jgi:heme o synthase
VSDYWNLARPKIVALVLAAMLVSGWEAAETAISWPLLIHAMLGTIGLIVGAIALNQRLESHSDAMMPRTADRPLPSSRLSSRQVTWFGLTATTAGTIYLIWLGNMTLVVLALISWICYVAIYTPLKKRSIWQTPIGALAGAMPAVLGAAAVGTPWSLMGWTLFGIVFCWQFPHAMAIAWLYRRQFSDAEIKVATVVDPSGRMAGQFALFGAVALLPVSLMPLIFLPAGWIYGVFAGLMGLGYLACSIAFFKQTNDAVARRLLRASLIYLPMLLMVLIVARKI